MERPIIIYRSNKRPSFGNNFRSLRWQLILRTLLPLGLLVVTFAIVGQIAYSQVTERLAEGRDIEIAKIEAARVGEYLQDAARALGRLADSPVLSNADASTLYPVLKDEPLSQHFD